MKQIWITKDCFGYTVEMISLHITTPPTETQAILVRRIPHQQSLRIKKVSDIFHPNPEKVIITQLT